MQLNQEVTGSDVPVERCSDAITIVPQDCFESQALLGIDPGLTPPRIQNPEHTAIRTPSSDYELTLSLHPMLNSLLSRRNDQFAAANGTPAQNSAAPKEGHSQELHVEQATAQVDIPPPLLENQVPITILQVTKCSPAITRAVARLGAAPLKTQLLRCLQSIQAPRTMRELRPFLLGVLTEERTRCHHS
jgi:hypothetical protein